ncbi:sigma-70 family RNA polymerase sigma factor [Pseudoalteromonas sp. MMG013]|uniref:sigma-70 family RNA polymerase sigma factor n=1 Tax=Pseudoalteromonas sp. MMG013 TaxID=2822687 RepID=UPI001B398B49|nr:sigma-70 family RNA polymerase sigma factor [Pseudoalteromonas sp. MMG013]MBQ4862974.1 sigma-70 family RNA polymerase sigma factor [Pseudoalteromonas sp. MMG013]
MSTAEEVLWTQWIGDKCQLARDAIFEMYRCWSEFESLRLSKKLRISGVESADFLSFGHEGLLHAIYNFDPDAGYMFQTYAQYRVKGNILNQVFKYSDQSQAYSKLRGKELTNSSQETLIDKVNSEIELVSLIDAFAMQYLLEQEITEPASNSLSGYFSSPEMDCLRLQCKDKVQLLPTQQRTVLNLHYFDFLDFQDISTLLDLSASRISQIHKDGLRSLAKHVNGS